MIRPSAPARSAWIAAACLSAACSFAEPERAVAELLWSQSFDSAALAGPMRFSIYLPPAYHAPQEAHRHYPVVYLLHGVGDDERAWPAFGRVEETLDRMIAAGDLPPFIVVMPNGARSRPMRRPAEPGPRIWDADRVISSLELPSTSWSRSTMDGR